ncbi:hypothetical protein D3C85_1625430 [compost metagenome]
MVAVDSLPAVAGVEVLLLKPLPGTLTALSLCLPILKPLEVTIPRRMLGPALAEPFDQGDFFIRAALPDIQHGYQVLSVCQVRNAPGKEWKVVRPFSL